jgi:DNA-binding GntR family transcriptional regulator
MSLERIRVYASVRTDILSCSLMPGAELREAELAERYGVSKSPVRDAMQKLEYEGLVEIAPRRGHRVRPVSVRDAEDILDLRLILETAIVRRIADNADAVTLRRLDGFRTADMSSIAAFTAYNRGFHHGLSQMSGNRRLAEEMKRTMELYDRLCVISLSTLQHGCFDGPLADHVAIVDALQARNGADAARVIRRHVTKSRGQILKGLQNRPVVA